MFGVRNGPAASIEKIPTVRRQKLADCKQALLSVSSRNVD
jgi:hypothetical protein